MKLMNHKAGLNFYSIAAGILIAIAVLATVKYFHDRNNDVTIHLPKVEVH